MACFEHIAAAAVCRCCGRRFPSAEAARTHLHACLAHRENTRRTSSDSDGDGALDPVTG